MTAHTLTYGEMPDAQLILDGIGEDKTYKFGNINAMPDLISAVNQGIDGHLEAIMFTQDKADVYVEKASMPTLIRRLIEIDTESSLDLVSGILQTINIEWI